jgi:hypothetical protein
LKGTGLSDVTKVPGEFVFELAYNMSIDFMTIGNHELYDTSCVENIAENVTTHLSNRFLFFVHFTKSQPLDSSVPAILSVTLFMEAMRNLWD